MCQKMIGAVCRGAVFLAALLCASMAGAQTGTGSPAPPKETLARALKSVPPPKTGVALTVAAEAVTLPPPGVAPPAGAPLSDVADAFGRTLQSCGDVTAVAPATMTLLNDQPGEPDLSGAISPSAALLALAAGLSDGQWQALTSAQGLMLSDLTTEDQQQLFWALFPGHRLLAAPAHADGTQPKPEEASDCSAALDQARLRLSQTSRLLPTSRGGNTLYTSISPDPSGTASWVVVHDQQAARKTLYGQDVRADVPNAPKAGDLDFELPTLQTPISVTGLKTVGDLVARVGRVSDLELYADPHYAARSLTVLGPAGLEPGGDLLRALAFCVTGTFRRVGPAYVLTDNLTGVAADQQIWSEYREHARALLEKIRDEAKASLFGNKDRSPFSLPSFDGEIGVLPTQEHPDPGSFGDRFLPEQSVYEKPFPFAQLTPDQQAAARRIASDYASDNREQIAKDPTQAPDPQGTWRVNPQYRLDAFLPSLPQPVTLQQEGLLNLAWPPDDVFNERMKAGEKWEDAQALRDAEKKAGPLPPLSVVLARTPRRAVLAAPHTPAEVVSLVAAMKKLGLNELWLSVFQNGVARVPSTPLPPPDGVTGPADPNADILGAALDATKGTGIRVLPVLDLLTWGKAPPEAVRDVNILGETSVQNDTRQRENNPFASQEDDPPPPAGMSVSPAAPDAAKDLAALVRAVAARPGLGGLVWRATAPTGYLPSQQSVDNALGYTPAMRLAFLRRAHADPWDVSDGGYSRLDFHLPEWDDPTADAALMSQWSASRAETDLALLRSLYGAAQSSSPAGSLPIWIEQVQTGPDADDGWFGTWDTPHKRLPAFHYDTAEGGDGDALQSLPAASQAKAESRFAVVRVRVKADDQAQAIALHVGEALTNKPLDGLILDITEADGGPGISGLGRLAGL